MAVIPRLGRDRYGAVSQTYTFGTSQVVAYTGTAGTIANGSGTTIVRIVCTSAAYLAIGAAPTATTAGVYIPANWVEYVNLSPGDKVSAVQVSSGGNLHVTECV